MKTVPFVHDAGGGNFLHDNFIVDVHIQHTAVSFDIFGNLRRPDNVERIVPVHLRRKHQEAGNTRNMIGVGVADKNNGNLFPPQIQPPEGHLRPLPAVKEEQFSLPPQKHGSQMPVRERHHAAAA